MLLPAALLLGSVRQYQGRYLVSMLAIALGVALGFAVQVINQSAIGEFGQALRTLSGEADLTVRGSRAGFDEALYPRLAQLDEVAVASPAVELDVRVVGHDEPLHVVGVDVFRAGQIQPGLYAEADELVDTLRDDTIFLGPGARAWLRVDIGDRIAVQAGLREVQLRVAGWLRAEGSRQRLAVMDIAAVQWLFGKLGHLTRIDLKLRPGADLADVEVRLRGYLPAGVYSERPERSVRGTERLTRAYRVNLNVLALVALFTGGLLVFSTQALSIVRRRSQLALLRVVGVTRRGLVGLLLAEGALVGVVGGVLGVLLGYALAWGTLRLIGPDLGAGLFRGIAMAPSVMPEQVALFFGLGVAAAVLGSLLPAFEAGRAAPAAALRAGDDTRLFGRFTAVWPGLTVVALGMLATPLPALDGLPIFGYVAIALLLVGTILLMPRLMVLALRLAPASPWPAPQLARAQLANAPGPATVSLAPIVAAVSLTVSMLIMIISFRQSLEHWLDRVLPADLYVTAGGPSDTAFLSAEDQRRLAAAPSVRRALFVRSQPLLLDAAQPPVTLLARDVDRFEPSDTVPLIGDFAVPSPEQPPPAWVSEAMVDVYGFTPGKVIELPIAGAQVRFTVAGVWRDYVRQSGAVVIERERYVALAGDDKVNGASVWLQPGVSVDEASSALRAALEGGHHLEIEEPAQIRALSLRIFDRSFAATYALQAAAIVIGLTGLSTGLASQVLARRREFGVLRHVGMTRRQIAAMLASEGLLTCAVGLLVGGLLGFAISLILIHVVNRQSFHWSMELHMPWLLLGLFCGVLLGLAAASAVLAGRRALGRDAVQAVREDW
jgi:putative ABC transport system permease protein